MKIKNIQTFDFKTRLAFTTTIEDGIVVDVIELTVENFKRISRAVRRALVFVLVGQNLEATLEPFDSRIVLVQLACKHGVLFFFHRYIVQLVDELNRYFLKNIKFARLESTKTTTKSPPNFFHN